MSVDENQVIGLLAVQVCDGGADPLPLDFGGIDVVVECILIGGLDRHDAGLAETVVGGEVEKGDGGPLFGNALGQIAFVVVGAIEKRLGPG
jgi:hypothetical protein